MKNVRKPTNKSNASSVDYKTARYAKVSAAKCRDLFKLTDNVDGCIRVHPSGLTEQLNRFVNDFWTAGVPEATSIPVISASRFNRSVRLHPEGIESRMGLVRRFLRYLLQPVLDQQ